jgi:hypothetical protein
MVQLADMDMPNITTRQRGNGDLEIGTSSLPYQIQSSFESGSYNDVYLVDVNTGSRRLVLEKYRGSFLSSMPGCCRIVARREVPAVFQSARQQLACNVGG